MPATAARTSGVGGDRPSMGLPLITSTTAPPAGEDMMGVSVSTRSGWLRPRSCVIMPPIDAPTMWAFPIP